jgi:hypothetical protein
LNIDTIAGIKSDARRIADLATAWRGRRGDAGGGRRAAAGGRPRRRAAFARLGDAVIQYGREAAAGFGTGSRWPTADAPKCWLQKGDAIQNPFTESRCRIAAACHPMIPGQK